MVVGLAGLVTLAAGAGAGAGTRDLRKITLVTNSRVLLAGTANLWIGKELGHFAEEGLDPDFITSDGASQVMQWLANGTAQIATIAPDPVLQFAARGIKPPVKLVYNFNRGITNQIAVRPESPIRETQDLRGRRIGILSFGHFSYDYAKFVLRGAGVDPDREATFIAVGQGAPAALALYNNQVDALSLFDVAFISIEGLGYKLRWLPQPPFIREVIAGVSVAVQEDFLRTNREMVGGFLRAVTKGTVWYINNPEATVRLHWKMFPESKPKGKTEEVALKETVAQLKVRAAYFRKELGGTNRYGAFYPPGWEGYARYAGVEGKINVHDLYTNELIDLANDFDEARVRQAALSFDPKRLEGPGR
jgi:NitT/TauT family transport system substrate-binding protein